MHPHNPYQPPKVPAPPPPPPPGMLRNSWELPPHGPLRYGQAPQQPYVIPPRPFNHGKHVIADLLTFGFWVPFHLLLWALHPRKSTIVYPDGRRERR